MKHLISIVFILATLFGINAQVVVVGGSSMKKSSRMDEAKGYFHSSIKDATWKRDVDSAYVIPYDKNGNPTDTIYAEGYKWDGSGIIKTSDVSLPVMEGDTSIVFEAGAPGYETKTVHWTFKPFAKREMSRNMDPIFLNKQRVLKELVVTSSKVKFYHKGDTIVYDADAFQLAEGSMLDALISQLPGASIDENGRITVNGEFVETLLLNGKDLFNDDHSVALENIPAYTVKNVEVYKGQTKQEKRNDDRSAPKHLTMDVKLKKEYNNGWIINAQGGYGTSDRYLGRLFASWFSPTTTLVITGLSNNLNDNRTPGKSDSWTPESMPSGTITTHSLAVNYNHERTDESLETRGYASLKGGSNDFRTSTSSTNFLSGGNTYERRFSNSKMTNLHFNTWHDAYFRIRKRHNFSLFLRGDYGHTDNNGDGLSGTFNEDYSDISRQALEAIYSDASAEVLKSVVNRSATVSEGRLTSGSIDFRPGFSFRLPNSSDRIGIGLTTNYVGSKRRAWNDYEINFGSDPVPSDRRRQFTDESPNYKLNLGVRASYSRPSKNSYFTFSYAYTFTDAAKDSYMYALDRLEDMGVFGVLPAGYESTLDPSNSYSSRTFTNNHTISINYNYNKSFEKSALMIMLSPTVGIEHNRFDYWRENRNYLVKRTTLDIPQTYATLWIRYSFGKPDNENAGANRYNNRLEYRGSLRNQAPQLLHLVDVISDSDPLNIQEGNPNLRNAYVQDHTLFWTFLPYGKSLNNRLSANLEVINDALVRGYTYDTATGVRRHRTYNVNGNINFRLSDFLNWEFGRQKQFGLSSNTSWSLMNNTDMVGVNLDAPVKAQVRNLGLSEDLTLSYRIGKQLLRVNGSVTHRHTSSERPDFNTIDAQHYKYGISGTFALPAGFGISTDLNFYKRVGYGVRELDTTDAVWNMRLTYAPPRNKHWVICADGFDLLHNLSNVNYAVTATGRTITYTNSLPRYFIVTVQYKLNIQPKK